MLKFFKLNPLYIALFSIFVGLLAYWIGVPFLDLVELKTIDLRFQARGEVPPRPEVVLAVIDEKSIAKEGKWVWPRSKLAKLVEKLSAAGARVIGFDIGFLEPDGKQLAETIEKIKTEVKTLEIRNRRIDSYLDNLKRETDNDRRLAEAIRNAGTRVVLGFFFQMEEKDTGHISAEELKEHEENVKGAIYKLVRFESGAAQKVKLKEALVPQSNIREIAEAAPYAGYFNMEPARDGVVRWIPGLLKFKDQLYAPLALSALGAYLKAPLSARIAEFGVESIQIGELVVPTDESGQIYVNYRGGGKTFPHIPVTDILNDQVPAEQLKDRIVLVGATAVGIYDLRVTPFSNVFPGLEIHANVIDAILSQNFLRQPGWVAIFDLMAIVLSGIFLGIVLPRVGAIFGALAGILLMAAYIFLCQYFFSSKGLILNLIYPVSIMILTYVGITLYKYIVESSQKRFIRDAFSTYLAPSVVKQIIDSPEKLVLGGEQRDITAFFSDVQGFTSISEKLTAHELVELLNEFLTEMTDIILKFEGTLDKFEGDAIIAFFGAPNDLENHAETACRACIEMQKRLVRLREKWQAEGRPELKMRIGLYSGPAVVGNMGSKNRMDYTMMGDTVNTAARLEGVNKVYGIYTLIGETTNQAAGDGILTREIDCINVVGKKEPVGVYQLLGYRQEVDGRLLETVTLYAQALQAYRNREWDGAIDLFSEALKITPDDGPSAAMLARCRQFKESPPEKDWDGTFAMSSK